MTDKISISIYREDHERLKQYGRPGEPIAEWVKRILDLQEKKHV